MLGMRSRGQASRTAHRTGLPCVLVLAVATLAGAQEPPAGSDPGTVLHATVDDAISPVTAEFILESLQRAEDEEVALFLLQLSTPGGLDVSMRDIMQGFLSSPVPTAVWVAPSGARAASAGFMIALSADLVAMAPGTNMGAATPVSVGGEGMDETMASKVIQDAVAYARSVAEQRGRPADLAAEAVSEGRSFPAGEALEVGLADAIAGDLEQLLEAFDGRSVRQGEQALMVHLEGATVVPVEMSLRQRVLSTLANPQIAYILMLLGIAGLYFELSNPGVVLPGVVGAVSLVLALLAFQQLPISYAGLALLALGIIFLILEVNVVSYGLLTVAGLISFVLGSLLLFRGPIPEMRLHLSFVLPVALVFLGLSAALVRLVVGAHRSRVATGAAGLVSEVGKTVTELGPDRPGEVFVHGELWKARSEVAVDAGQPVEIIEVESGLRVRVRPVRHDNGS